MTFLIDYLDEAMQEESFVSPYLRRPLRSLEEVLRQRHGCLARRLWGARVPSADNSNAPPPHLSDSKSA